MVRQEIHIVVRCAIIRSTLFGMRNNRELEREY
jgi:hypothetical protein